MTAFWKNFCIEIPSGLHKQQTFYDGWKISRTAVVGVILSIYKHFFKTSRLDFFQEVSIDFFYFHEKFVKIICCTFHHSFLRPLKKIYHRALSSLFVLSEGNFSVLKSFRGSDSFSCFPCLPPTWLHVTSPLYPAFVPANFQNELRWATCGPLPHHHHLSHRLIELGIFRLTWKVY